MADLVTLARLRNDDNHRTHREGCERHHRECLIQRMADRLETVESELERERMRHAACGAVALRLAAEPPGEALMRQALITMNKAINFAEFWIERADRRTMSDDEYKTWYELGYGSHTMRELLEARDVLRKRLGEDIR